MNSLSWFLLGMVAMGCIGLVIFALYDKVVHKGIEIKGVTREWNHENNYDGIKEDK